MTNRFRSALAGGDDRAVDDAQHGQQDDQPGQLRPTPPAAAAGRSAGSRRCRPCRARRPAACPAPTGASAPASGSQVCSGTSGALIANAMANPAKIHIWVDSGIWLAIDAQGRPVEGAARRQHVARRHVQPDHGRQHQQPAEQRVQEELRRRVRPAHPAERPDQEVHRDQHDLEHDVEDEHVGGGEDADHRRLQDQQQREVAADGAAGGQLLLPRGAEHDRHQHRDQRDHRQRDAVDAEREADPEERDPVEARTSRRTAVACCPRSGTTGSRSTGRRPARARRGRTPSAVSLTVLAGAPRIAASTIAPTTGSTIMISSNGFVALHANLTSEQARMTPGCRRTWTARTTGRSRSASAPSAGQAAEAGGEAVDRAVDALGVGEDQRPVEPDAGPRDQRLVDRVAADVGAGQRDDRR